MPSLLSKKASVFTRTSRYRNKRALHFLKTAQKVKFPLSIDPEVYALGPKHEEESTRAKRRQMKA